MDTSKSPGLSAFKQALKLQLLRLNLISETQFRPSGASDSVR